MKPLQLLALQDQTQAGLDPKQLQTWTLALWRQAYWHYGFSPWVQREYAAPAKVIYVPRGAAIPAGAWPLLLYDTSDQAGALGYHEDEFASKAGPSGAHASRSAAETPLSRIFVATCQEDKVEPSEVISHEMLEMIVDPWVTNEADVRTVPRGNAAGDEVIVEVGDPVQGCGYTIGGVLLADFAWPAWFGMAQVRPNLSQRSSVGKPFELAREGYISLRHPNGEWTQEQGSAHAARAAGPDRS